MARTHKVSLALSDHEWAQMRDNMMRCNCKNVSAYARDCLVAGTAALMRDEAEAIGTRAAQITRDLSMWSHCNSPRCEDCVRKVQRTLVDMLTLFSMRR